MGLRLRRTPIIVTRLLLGVAVTAAVAVPPFASLAANRIAGATATPDLSKIRFISDERYVRENNAGDLDAQVVTYNATTDVKFYVDGDSDHPITGQDYGAQGANYRQWRLYTALDAGKHTITAKVEIDDTWYDVNGTVTVYSLDMPALSYVYPNGQSSIFRPSDNPLRIKADDDFNQLKYVSYSIYKYDTDADEVGAHVGIFQVNRDQCDLRQAGKYALCDATASDTWAALGEGVYLAKLSTNTKANNGARTNDQDYWVKFYVDGMRPEVSDFRIDSATTVKDSLVVSANATDAIKLESVLFYVTAPRESDGACTGNGTKLAQLRVSAPGSDGRYHATLDVSGIDTHGQSAANYCVTAIARDEASNNSTLESLHFAIDHRAPIVTLKVTSSKTPTASTPVVLAGTVDGPATLELFEDGTKVDGFAPVIDADGNWTFTLDGGLKKGDHTLKVVATDGLGNASSEASSPESFLTMPVGGFVTKSHISRSLAPPQLPQNPVAPTAASFAQVVASQSSPTVAAKDLDDQAILGAETSKDETASSPTEAAVTPSVGGWMFFGLAWYWWLVGAGLLAGGASWLVAGLRAKASQIA